MPAFIGQRDFHKCHLDGKKVRVAYLQDYIQTGVVESSRVCYGGTLMHTVRLDKPIVVPWDSTNPYRYVVRILEHWKEDENELLEILE
jgi:hypothetical protein